MLWVTELGLMMAGYRQHQLLVYVQQLPELQSARGSTRTPGGIGMVVSGLRETSTLYVILMFSVKFYMVYEQCDDNFIFTLTK